MTDDFNGKTYWVVGASEGLGAELAWQLDALGARLIVSARNAEKLDACAAELSDATPIAMDVTDQASVKNAIRSAGDVYGVVYCVGQYAPMKTQDWNLDASLKVIDANYLGAVRVFAGIVPTLFKRRAGHVVVIGSLAGFHGLPGAIGYSSSKGALMQLCENMFMDAYGTGVKVQQINPGYIETRLSAKNDFHMPGIMSAQAAANRVVRAMQSNRFRTTFPKPFAWLFTLGRLLPAKLYRRIFH